MSLSEQDVSIYFPAKRAANDEMLETLRSVPLLSQVPERVLERLATSCRLVAIDGGTELYRQGDPADRLYVVIRGQLAGFTVAPNGSTAIIDVIHAGQTLGLAPVLAKQQRLMGVRTVTDSLLLQIEANGLMGLAEDEPALIAALLQAEAQEFSALLKQVCDLKLRTTAQRLGCYLLSLCKERYGNTSALRLPFDKRLLAARLGCRQENLSRAFAALRQCGVETHGARVILHDIARLQAYAEPDELPA
ncbi:MAG TPA: cyclic nucleotide-binding domain-containing protein [Rhodopila sp.]|nr:cyclic nucleotide-binding domain-containing protein [Rhodopila sp.]